VSTRATNSAYNASSLGFNEEQGAGAAKFNQCCSVVQFEFLLIGLLIFNFKKLNFVLVNYY